MTGRWVSPACLAVGCFFVALGCVVQEWTALGAWAAWLGGGLAERARTVWSQEHAAMPKEGEA